MVFSTDNSFQLHAHFIISILKNTILNADSAESVSESGSIVLLSILILLVKEYDNRNDGIFPDSLFLTFSDVLE